MSEETISKKEFDKLKKWYSEEIKKRDKIIDKLREQNSVLLSTSLKQGGKNAEVTAHAKSLMGINKRLREKLKQK